MKKILLAIDSMKLEMNALDFACYISKLTRSNLTGVFLENKEVEEHGIKTIFKGTSRVQSEGVLLEEEKEVRWGFCDDNIRLFKEGCEIREVLPSVHRDRGIPLNEMIVESRFADMMVIDAETSFSSRFEGMPTGFVKDVLSQAECPVIIAPKSFDGINEIIFAYDGSGSSVYAIRQFTYLLPQYRNFKVNIVHVTKEKNDVIEKKHNMSEWLKVHYSDVHFTILHEESGDKLFEYLVPKKNAFVVLGSFGRSGVSQFFKPSRGELIAKAVNLPLFIAHF